jgi:hypothetical protein
MQPSERSSCTLARAALAAAITSGHHAPVSQAARRHVQQCPRCHVELLVLATALEPALRGAVAPIDCARCMADLAAFIELEQASPGEAARTFPAVWWHLWTCADCALTYEIMVAALASAAMPELPALTPAAAPAQACPPILLKRQVLSLLFPEPCVPAPTYRGSEQAEMVVYDAPDEYDQAVTVSLQHQDDGAYRVIVRTDPPHQGRVVLICGGLALQAPFDAGGSATIGNVSACVITSPASPDLDIRLV